VHFNEFDSFFWFLVVGRQPKAQVAAGTEDDAISEVGDRQSAVAAGAVGPEGSLFGRTRASGDVPISEG